jgi:hypothetical protein
MKCLLCDQNEANQTGAHIFPAWMTATAFDVAGRNRDYEIIFSLRPFVSKLPYFGRSVQPEKITEQIGREISENEIQEQVNELVVNNLWCRNCEKRFKIVEDYFHEQVDLQLTDFSKCNDTGVSDLKETNKYIIRLFLYSLFFRAHVADFMEFHLYSKTYKKIKYFLNYYIKDDLNATIDFINSSYRNDQILKYPIRCFKIEQRLNESKGWVFIHNKHYKPYGLVINNYFIQFYGKGDHARFRPESFFGISSIISSMPNIRNYKESEFKIGLLDKKIATIILKNCVDYLTDLKKESLAQGFKKMYKIKFKRYPDEITTQIFLKELIVNDLPPGLKYTKENIKEALKRTLIKKMHFRQHGRYN